jgi:hypothetical protein
MKNKIQKVFPTINEKENIGGSEKKTDSYVHIYRYKDINFSNVEISELNKTGKQPLSYIYYNDPAYPNSQRKLLLQSGWIKLTHYGIPPLDTERGFYTEDSQREFIKIPLDPRQDSCRDLRNHLEDADEWAGSSEIRKKLLGNYANNYEYQSCIRTPQLIESFGEDDNDGKKDVENDSPVNYVKMKFNVVTNENKDRINQTKLIRRNRDNTRTTVVAKSITEIANEIKYLSEIRFIFMYSKIWVNMTKLRGANKLLYGIGLKIMAIEYIPNNNKSINVDSIDFRLSDDEDDKEEIIKPSAKAKQKFDSDEDIKSTVNSKKKKFDEREKKSDDEDYEDDEDDKEEIIKPNAKAKQKFDSDEDIKSTVNSKKKKFDERENEANDFRNLPKKSDDESHKIIHNNVSDVIVKNKKKEIESNTKDALEKGKLKSQKKTKHDDIPSDSSDEENRQDRISFKNNEGFIAKKSKNKQKYTNSDDNEDEDDDIMKGKNRQKHTSLDEEQYSKSNKKIMRKSTKK